MLDRIFPKQADNTYRGHRLALWLLVLIVLLKLAMSYGILFDTRHVIQTADSIALDSFDAPAQDAVVLIFRLLGVSHLLLALLGVVVLLRYRALIPFFYVVLLIEQIARKAIVLAFPIARTGVEYLPVDPNLVFAAALAIGLVLSLQGKRYATA